MKLKDLPPRTERQVLLRKGGGDGTVAPALSDGAASTIRLLTTGLPVTECANHSSRREPGPSAAPLDDYKSDQKSLASRVSRRLKDGHMRGSVCPSRVKNCEGGGSGDYASQSPMGTEGAGTCINTSERRRQCRQRQPESSHCHISSPTVGKSKSTIGPGNSSWRSGDVKSERFSEACRGAMMTPLTEEKESRSGVDLCNVAPPPASVASAPMDDLTLGKLIKGSGNVAADPEGKVKTLELISLLGDSKPLAMAKTNAGTRWESSGAVQIRSVKKTKAVDRAIAGQGIKAFGCW